MANEFKVKNGLISGGDIIVSGSIIATQNITISGSIASAETASFAPNYTTTSSFNSYTSSFSSSVATTTNNLSNRTTTIEGNYTTTGSNVFNGNQVITGSINTTGNIITSGQIIAQTLNVQQVTSSVVYSSGSNVFGNNISNTHQFTGSLFVSGSNHYFSGNIGIGTTTIQTDIKLDVRGGIAVGGGTEGIRLGNVGDNTAYDNVKLYYNGYNGGYPIVYLTPRTTPGSGVIQTFLHLQNSNGSDITSNNKMGLLVDGDIGVGTTLPYTPLHLVTTNRYAMRSDVMLTGTTNNYLFLNNTNANYGVLGTVSATGTLSGDVFGLGYTPAMTSSFIPVIRWTSSGAVSINTSNFDVGGSSNGVAILDDHKILVSNNTTGIGSFLYYGDRRGTNNEGIVYMLAMGGFYKSSIGVIGTNNITDDGGITFSTIEGNANVTERVRITKNGMGIGMTNPQTPIHIIKPLGSAVFGFGEASNNLRLSMGQETGYTGNYINSSNIDLKIQTYLASGSGGNIIFQTNNDGSSNVIDRMKITPSGMVGINASTPLARLHIDNGVSFFRNTGPGASAYTAYIGSIAPNNNGDRYLHVKFNTIGSMMYWIKIFGYNYLVGLIEGMAGGYISGGVGDLTSGYINGSIVAQYQNNGFLEIVVDMVSTSTSNRWGSITFIGGTDNITTLQPIEIAAYSFTSTLTAVY